MVEMANVFTAAKSVYSMCLLLFSVVIVMALIYTGDTKLSRDGHPVVAYVVIWVATMWLAVVEGGQASLVGLPPVQPDLYKDSHPITHRITALAHKGDNLNRYLIGRQFLVVLIVFVTNLSGAPLEGVTVLGLPDILQDIFLSSGLAMILMLAMIGQLSAQVNASHCMLDFINSYVALATLYVALAIEFSGILHSAYLVQWMVQKLARGPTTSKSISSSGLQRFFFVGRIVLSLCILGFSFAVTISALFQGKTTMWLGVPKVISVLLFFLLMSVVGMLEGAQIAFFAVAKLDKSELGTNPVVAKTCELLFRGDGHNLPGFMIGRQILVTMCFFIIARVTTLNVDTEAGDETIFGVSDGVQDFFNTGLLGAIITTTVGSISWQLVASVFPVAFMHNPLVYVLLRICLFLESIGICSGAWVLASVHKYTVCFRRDEFYFARAAGSDSKVNAEGGSNVGLQPCTDVGPSLGTDPGTFHIDPAKYINAVDPSTIGSRV
ncbi:unnamed protein product [Prorocentrum cordatum]|uniref:Silicon transporter n=1 Tax=Prorocentrum cordatum TaxID=2364126 RepID=A0ABN9XLL9_9DINO|nr:unnamed protein product [Polarella glacialis]